MSSIKKKGWTKNTLHKCIKCKKVILWEPNRCFVCAVELKKSREEANV